MNRVFASSFCYKVIYAFEINADTHKGLLKIGDATLNTDSPVDSLSPNSRERRADAASSAYGACGSHGEKYRRFCFPETVPRL